MNEQLRRSLGWKRVTKRAQIHQKPLLSPAEAQAILAKHAKEVAILAQARRATEGAES